MSENGGATAARKYSKKAVGSLQSGQQVLEDPSGLFRQGYDIGLNFAKNPLSLSPEIVATMKQRGFDEAGGAFQGALNTIGERMGAMGMYRSGGTNTQFQNAAAEYGGRIADVSRQVDTDAAKQRNTDWMQAISAILPLIQQQQRPYEQIANAYMATGSNPAFGQPGSGLGIGQGIGSLLGALIA